MHVFSLSVLSICVCLSVCLSVSLFICLPVYPPACLSQQAHESMRWEFVGFLWSVWFQTSHTVLLSPSVRYFQSGAWRRKLPGDLAAGLTVGVMNIPQGEANCTGPGSVPSASTPSPGLSSLLTLSLLGLAPLLVLPPLMLHLRCL